MDASPGRERLVVFAAMRPEIRPLVRRLRLRREPGSPTPLWRGRAADREWVACVTSMGTRAAAETASRVLDAERAGHVAVLGIAGGIDPRLRVGDLLDPAVVIDEASGARFHPDARTPTGAAGTGAATGPLLTTDTLHNTPEALERLRRQGYAAVDMETAAIAAAAEARGIGWSVYRAVSDLAGDPDVDPAVVGLARPDGSPDPWAIGRTLIAHPGRIPRLAALGRGMRRAVRTATAALLARWLPAIDE